MSHIEIRGLVKQWGLVVAVDQVSFAVPEGSLTVLLGPSGCGKSTILRLIAGLETVSAGSIAIGGNEVTHMDPAQRGVSMVFQSYALFPHLDVRENILFGLKVRGISPADRRSRLDEAAHMVGLEELLDRKPAQLSGGQRQRVALARSIVSRRRVCLMDEPLSNLDAKLRTQMRLEIKQLHKRIKATIIYVTHDQVEAMTLGDRIVVLRDGFIEQVGSPLDLFHYPENTFVAGFIGSPPMNLVACRINKTESGDFLELKGGVTFPVPEKEGAQFSDGQEAIMGLRTGDIVPDEGNSQLPAEWKYEGTVEVTEPLGSETNIHMDLGGETFLAQCDGRIKAQSGDKLMLCFNLNHLHIFDAKSTRSIY